MREKFKGIRFNCDAENYVVFDIETTGLRNSEILEIAALRVREGSVVDSFHTFVKPKMRISEEVSVVNGITEDMVKDSPCFSDIAPRLSEFFGDDILVGHYLEKFALQTLDLEMKRATERGIENDYIDLYHFAIKCCSSDIDSFTLKSISSFLGVSADEFVGAMKDARLIYECFVKISDFYRADKSFYGLYAEKSEEFRKFISKCKQKKDVSAIRHSIEGAYCDSFDDPILRCCAMLPLIKYELYIGRFEEELSGELFGIKRDFDRGLYSRMSIADVDGVKKDLDYCLKGFENRTKRKRFFGFFGR